MQVQEDTKRIKYNQVFQQVAVNISATHHWYNNQMRDKLAPFDMTVQQYHVLRILNHQFPTPATINLIKGKMLDKMSDASRIVERLIQKGLVLKSNNLSDRRATAIHLTAAGQEMLTVICNRTVTAELLVSKLSIAEAMQLNQLLEKLRR
jgi:DNA-binding MarR family transcriptional regulator